MEELIEVTLPTGTVSVPFGTSLAEVVHGTGPDTPLAAIVNGETQRLGHRITEPVTVTPLRLSDRSGYAVYARSLAFLLILAVPRVLPGAGVRIEHAINNEIGATILRGDPLTDAEVAAIEAEMRALVTADHPIDRVKMKRDDAIALFDGAGMADKVALMRHANRTYLTLYRCLGVHDYLYGTLVPSTGYLSTFRLVRFGDGVLLLLPDKHPPHAVTAVVAMPKLRAAFAETESWARILDAGNVGAINASIDSDAGRDMVLVSESLHEKNLSRIADTIAARADALKLILIAGPSSSGKTTFSRRLAIHLRVLGLDPFAISADDYFIDRDQVPVEADGHQDFESISTVDTASLTRDLERLLTGDEIPLRRFDFVTGQGIMTGQRYAMHPESVLILEGIHGLNDALTPTIPAANKFKIYASALNPLNLDDHTSIYVSDVRTLRRMARDNRTRGMDAERTLRTWPSVRVGEEKSIFPYQEQADVMFNSSLLYELNALKPHTQPLLERVDRDSPVYGEAMRMLEFLSFFTPLADTFVPAHSIVREFIGGSCFA